MIIAIDAQLASGELVGVQYCILDLIEHLAQIDSTNRYVVYFNPAFDFTGVRLGANFVARRSILPTRVRAVRVLWEQAFLPGRLRRDGVDVLHSPAYVTPAMSTVPAVVTIPDVIALRAPSLCRWSNRTHFRLLLPQSARKARCIITVSHASRAEIVRTLGIDERRIHVIENGISPVFRQVTDPARREDVRRRYALPGRFVLFVGHIEPKKNLERLVEAFERARQGGVSHELVIAGRAGWTAGRVRARIERSPARKFIHLLGYLPRADLPALYSMADLFAFPSLVEGFGIPPVEAMACGTPVMASNIPSVREVVGDAGIFVDPYDAIDMARGMVDGLTNNERREILVARGFERAQRYSWNAAAQKTLEVYERALESAV